MKNKKATFQDFLHKFPVIELPITLTQDLSLVFSKENEPLNTELIHEFIIPHGLEEPTEFTEYVPCFRLEQKDDYEAVVIWIADLLTYYYWILIYDKQGGFLDRYRIAGTKTKGQALVQMIGVIKDDRTIFGIEGEHDLSPDALYEAGSSEPFKLEILPSGEIIHPFE